MLVRCAAIERKTFSFSSICLEAPPPQTTCLPKRADIEHSEPESPDPPPGPVAESYDSGEGPHFTIPSEAVVPSPQAQHESVRMSTPPPVRSSRESSATASWHPARSTSGFPSVKRGVEDYTYVAEQAAMRARNPDKYAPAACKLLSYLRALHACLQCASVGSRLLNAC
jgi:hypothetical protein